MTYLETTQDGCQYIDTGLIPQSNTTFRGKYEYLGIGASGSSYDMIAGCTNPRYYPASLNNTTDNPKTERYVYGQATSGTTSQFNKVESVLTSHTVVFNDAQHRVFKDGVELGTFTVTFGTNKRNCYLFAANTGNGSGSASYFSYSRIYWCEFIDSTTGEVLRRFIPVVDNEDRPAMFDEIEGKLYYNLGSGADFTAGPRKDGAWFFVEYLESDGSAWIDTGYLATSYTETHVGYKYTDTTQVDYAMICGSVNPKRHYPVSLNGKNPKKERFVHGDYIPTLEHSAVQHHEVVFNDGAKNIFSDGRYVGTVSATIKTNTTPFALFAAGNTGSNKYISKSRIYHCEFYDDGMTQRAFVPAVAIDENGDAVPCMYERCGETNHYNVGSGSFTAGRIISPEVPLKLADRDITPSDSLNVLAFTERPSYGTVFTLDEAYTNSYDVEVRSDGVYTVAKGTGSDATNVIAVTGSTSAQFATNAMPTCASVVLSGTVTLAADCDWTGLGTLVIPDGVTIDLNGHDLHLSGFTCLPDDVTEITDTVGGGELHVTVAENDVLNSDRVLLSGSLKLVKHGTGVFVASRMNQDYAGGTDVAEGILRVANKDQGNSYRYELGSKTSAIRIGDGAELVLNGIYNQEFIYTFDGGTLSSGISPDKVYRQIGSTVTFEGDGTVTGQNLAFMVGSYAVNTIYMNGNTLHVNLNAGMEFTLCNATFEGEGSIEGLFGWVKVASNPCVGTNLTLRFPGDTGGLWLDRDFTVSNFVSHTGIFHKGADGYALTVLGTYTPAEDGRTAFPNMILANGATLDLSQMDDVPTLATSCTSGNYTRTISFADNATVKVKLGDRQVSEATPIVGWETAPENLAGLKFVCADEGRRYAVEKRSDGLYIARGFMLIVR